MYSVPNVMTHVPRTLISPKLKVPLIICLKIIEYIGGAYNT